MEAIIRKATAEEYETLYELFDELDALHRSNLPHLFQEPSGPVRQQGYFQGLIADKNTLLLVAGVGEKVVGFVHAVIRDAPSIPVFIPQSSVIVDGIGVKAGFQNKGIGRMLMDSVHEWSVSKGAATIELNVYEFNKSAIAFYQSLGYETLSRKMSKSLNDG